MKIFGRYVKQRLSVLALLGSFSLVFSIVFSLYSLEAEAVIYAAGLCFCLLFIISGIDYFRFFRRHQIMQRLTEEAAFSLSELPKPESLSEEDCFGLIKTVFESKQSEISELQRQKKDTEDYFTLWVHQIKTPIFAADLLVQSDSADRAEISEQLFKIEEYADRVLSYLRLGSETSDFVIRSCSLEEIARQAVRKYALLFVRKKIRLEMDSFDCEVLTDEKWLSFVFEQLLSNALKYTVSGKISIYMKTETTLVIEDSGIGISAADLPRVFEKSFTGYNGRTDKRATGIGLYLCREILGRLSHGIRIESEPGKGTKVYIDFKNARILAE